MSQRIHGGTGQFNGESFFIDLSVNINPYGPSHQMVSALKSCAFDQYPDPNGYQLKELLAARHLCDVSQIHLGNGAAEIFWTIIRSKASHPLATLILEPTFSEFRVAARAHGFPLYEARSHFSQNRFRHDFDELRFQLRKDEIRLVYICNPNSPTGHYYAADEICALASEFSHVTFILDQAFIQLSEHYRDAYVNYPENLLQVISLTKEHSIPGVRIGYAVGSSAMVSQLDRFIHTWNINAFALQAGLSAIENEDFVRASFEKISKDKMAFCKKLDAFDICYHTADCPFIMVHIKDSLRFFHELKDQGILVRECTSYGLSDWVRIFPRPVNETEAFFLKLGRYLERI